MGFSVLAYARGGTPSHAEAGRSYGEVVSQAVILSATTRGDAYVHLLFGQERQVAAPARQACGGTVPGRSFHTLTLAAYVRADGSLGNVRFAPDDNLTRCFVGQLQRVKWPVPPGGDLAVAMRFNASTGELLSVVGVDPTGMPAMPPPPPDALRLIYSPPALRPHALAATCRGVVEVTPSHEGAVQKAVVVKPCGQPGADASALDAILQWVFMPSAGKGKAAERSMRIPFFFQQPYGNQADERGARL